MNVEQNLTLWVLLHHKISNSMAKNDLKFANIFFISFFSMLPLIFEKKCNIQIRKTKHTRIWVVLDPTDSMSTFPIYETSLWCNGRGARPPRVVGVPDLSVESKRS